MGIGGNMKSAFTTFRVKPGWMGLVGSEKGIQRIYLPGLKEEELRKRILSDFPECREGADFLSPAEKELTEYFSGRRMNFDFALDLSGATPFQKKAYTVMCSIPFGEVRTYRWLAQSLGNPKALRAVGGANAKNRWPIVIPCHRVIGSDGFLTGFSAPGGLALKTTLLELEGIPVENNRVKTKSPNS
jgi:methylated-DNA-[protein]-cysteine S-methyltransferase